MLMPLFWMTYVGWALSELIIFRRDRGATGGVAADRGSRAVIIVAMVVAIVAAANLAMHLPLARLPLPRDAALIVGMVVMWGGIALRLWSVRTLGRFFRTEVTMLDDHRLIAHGPYARLRNPSYAGAMVTCLGFGIALDNAASLAIILLVPGLAFAHRIRIEEAALARRFGAAWTSYRARSWALLPPVW
jgi:protein-S-isoprenylcysteine O-methyltransferase